jgi:predicted DCC family thiol-disulfide oxidoreductase YuxK
MTELTDNTVSGTVQGWVFFDRDCALCRRWARISARALRQRGLRVTPLQSAWAHRMLSPPIESSHLLDEMRILMRDRRLFGGADALLFLAGRFWWARPIAALARALPFVHEALARGYAWLARHRHCASACRVSPPVHVRE